MNERLVDLIEEHKPNLDNSDITTESFKYLYESLVKDLIQVEEEEKR